MKIGIDVNVEPGFCGGVAPALRSLIVTLGSLTDGPEEYAIIVGSDRQREWLHPLGANQKFVTRTQLHKPGVVRRSLRRLQDWLSGPNASPCLPISDGFYESLGCDVMHFPTQEYTLCAVPSVYNPHDLQHLHFPQFFTPSHVAWRETVCPAACHIAKAVIVNSQWVKEDVTQRYGIAPPSKVQVIPEAPPTLLTPEPSIDDMKRISKRYGLPERFAFYPAVAWPHKNHLRLLDALAHLRDHRGLIVPLVCTGALHEDPPASALLPRPAEGHAASHWPKIKTQLARLDLVDQVHFVGLVPEEDLRGLYRLARCLVLPTLFEANSLPIFEAWVDGTPVACSNVTALPEQVMDAGLIFNPFDPIAIADTIARLFTDDDLCEELRTKARRRLNNFDWVRTAKAYRAIYRRTAGQQLSEDDRMLLEWDWMRDPSRVVVPQRPDNQKLA